MFDTGEIFFLDGIASDEHEVYGLSEFVLMLPVRFTQQTLGSTANDRIPDFLAHHDTEA